MRLAADSGGYSGFTVGGFGYNPHVGLIRDHTGQAFAHYRVIVGDQDANTRHRSVCTVALPLAIVLCAAWIACGGLSRACRV